ncbi:hypothetical protein KIPB_004915 [Kipferlia bialata]|uniref:Uncharacterized protein n=1 Tax=Kipferlia bialata TaxID=797122 RepID=A0A9K3CW89_9EUKA|nr:hypothetical protein KIPB_004915 [Kipferlia bialata]|eukprot:g4915.t1
MVSSDGTSFFKDITHFRTPVITPVLAWLALIVNLFLPGWGTAIAAIPARRGSLLQHCPVRTAVIGKGAAWATLIVNLFLPGFGTLISAIAAKAHKGRIVGYAVLQFLTTPLLLFGWFWALFYSIALVSHCGKPGVYYPLPEGHANPNAAPGNTAPAETATENADTTVN